MKSITSLLVLLIILASCKNEKKAIVDKIFTDSLLAHYTEPTTVKANDSDRQFWKNRLDPKSTGYVNELRYAAALSGRFHLFGDIRNIRSADSVLQLVNLAFNNKEAAPNLALCANAILQHRFTQADGYREKARLAGLKPYEALTSAFDVDFELGRYEKATNYVKQLKPYNDYNYYFRRSKLDHLNGAMDSSIQAMLSAAKLAESSVYLEDVALSNAADLYIHNGELEKASNLYRLCIRMNSGDFHSITGLGWIALVHDNNDSLAQQLFEFVHARYKLPDPLFKLYQMAQVRGDSVLEQKYATAFAEQAMDTLYGNMYNKYLVEVYTGILRQPAQALAITMKELDNRATPQTYAWQVWALFNNGKKDEAYKLYEQQVSGKPLEGLELYWMGKLMQGLGKGYNAQEFFKAAWKNKYDLSPFMVTDLQKSMN